jgi:hypothetical protein
MIARFSPGGDVERRLGKHKHAASGGRRPWWFWRSSRKRSTPADAQQDYLEPSWWQHRHQPSGRTIGGNDTVDTETSPGPPKRVDGWEGIDGVRVVEGLGTEHQD